MARILNFVTWCVGGLFWATLVTINSLSWTPFIIIMTCWLYLVVIAYKRGWLGEPLEDDDDV